MSISYGDKFTPEDFYDVSQKEVSALGAQLLELNKYINADYLFIVSVDKAITEAKTAVVIHKNDVLNDFSYALKGSPCEQVSKQGVCCISHGVTKLYPEDKILKDMNVEGYIGVPVLSDYGDLLGILVGLYVDPTENIESHKARFLTFAGYINVYLQKCFLEVNASSRLSLLSEVEAMSNVGAWEYKVSTSKMYWSQQVYKIHGLPVDSDISAVSSIQYYNEVDQARISQLFEKVLLGQPYCDDFKFIDAQGNHKWVRTSGKAVKNNSGDVVRVYGAFEDITLERNLLSSAQERESRLETILDNLNDGVVTVNLQGEIVHSNLTAQHMFGYTLQEMLSLKVNHLMPGAYAARHDSYMASYEQTGLAKIIGVGRQLPAKRKNGDIFQMELSLTKSLNKGVVEYIGVVRDISERISAQDTIYNLAYSDPITGLKNKRWFEKECKSLIQRSAQSGGFIYAALLDIDKLGQFNLKYGIEAGNEALHLIAENLLKATDESCKLYKNGADSFLILSTHAVSDSTLLEALQPSFGTKLLNTGSFLLTISNIDVVLSASLGSAIFDIAKHSYESLLDKLEYALKQAKMHSPFGYYFANIESLKRYDRTNKIRYLLLNAIQNNELKLMLQPQFISAGKFNSSEALLRWDSKELGFVSPSEFIPIAEEGDIIIKIGDWVIDEVCRLLNEVNNGVGTTCIAVNISVKQIVANDFKSKLIEKIQKWNISPKNVVIELTETTLVSDIELVKATMLELNTMGFRFSIDDFGTGYSSLSYLKDLPIAELKIDKCFVDGIIDKNDSSSKTIVNMIIDMANALGVNSVAEGVEYQEQYEYLRERGCDLFQGYLFSKPVHVEQWYKMLKLS
jgi:PAS domain S-box-containing protein/diguanylate cyclase (GGDEF)-like protein